MATTAPATGLSSAVSDGSARYSTLRSIEYSRHGNAITAKASHSRRPARIAVVLTFASPVVTAGDVGTQPARGVALAGRRRCRLFDLMNVMARE